MRKAVETMMNAGSLKKSDGFSERCRIWRIAMLSTEDTSMSPRTISTPLWTPYSLRIHS